MYKIVINGEEKWQGVGLFECFFRLVKLAKSGDRIKIYELSREGPLEWTPKDETLWGGRLQWT